MVPCGILAAATVNFRLGVSGISAISSEDPINETRPEKVIARSILNFDDRTANTARGCFGPFSC
jgi:hypothetical protein